MLVKLAMERNTTQRRMKSASPPKIAGNSVAKRASGPTITNVGITARKGCSVKRGARIQDGVSRSSLLFDLHLRSEARRFFGVGFGRLLLVCQAVDNNLVQLRRGAMEGAPQVRLAVRKVPTARGGIVPCLAA